MTPYRVRTVRHDGEWLRYFDTLAECEWECHCLRWWPERYPTIERRMQTGEVWKIVGERGQMAMGR